MRATSRILANSSNGSLPGKKHTDTRAQHDCRSEPPECFQMNRNNELAHYFLARSHNHETAIKGAATIPLRIAAQKSALTGSMCMKFRDRPIRVAAVIAE